MLQKTILLTLITSISVILLAFSPSLFKKESTPAYIRHNLLGYLPEDAKVAIAFSEKPILGVFELVEEPGGRVVLSGNLKRSEAPGWGRFEYYYELDFSQAKTSGDYYLRLKNSDVRSTTFRIGPDAFGRTHEDLLEFMRQQRCGYNPFLDMVCHQRDGRAFYGPMPDSTYVDVSGGWHDAGDQLKYLITSSNA
ncbi:MAG TPA: glycoside hydrolase family 9 protein, partial [Saprospiraceae bacterium]|nr:glycoside hydrolase family 9 protein [Saprospiraceae bacterium]